MRPRTLPFPLLLFSLVAGVGSVPASAQAVSYLSRLTSADRERSREVPGSKRGFWTTLYTFDDESLGEVVNRTVHAFLLFALTPQRDCVYWAIYVRPVSRWTPLYMALIDPFRRFLVYPELIRRMEAAWRERGPEPPIA